jgi:hypothetical protein
MHSDIAARDRAYWRVYRDALRLQASCELIGMEVQARQAREIRRQATVRLVSLRAGTTGLS